MSYVGDRSELGIWTLRDERDMEPQKRLHLAGARFIDPEDDWSAHRIAEQGGKGSAGDIHPWTFWQGSSRGIGSWQSMFGSVIVGGGGTYGGRGGRFGGGGPGFSRPGDTGPGLGRGNAGEPGMMKVLPIRRNDYIEDLRYAQWSEGQPSHLPTYPGGYRVVATSGTDEKNQFNLLLPADGRIVAPQAWGPDRMGTTVCDMVSPGQLNKGGKYGVSGRDAPFQTLGWVVRVPVLGKPRNKAGNAVALNATTTVQGGMAGYVPIVATTKMNTQKETNGGQDETPPTTGGTAPDPNFQSARARAEGSNSKAGKADKAPRVATTTVAFMSQEASGPWSVGYHDDKHKLGDSLDDQPINAGHLHIDAYWEVDDEMDGPHEHTLQEYPRISKKGYPWVTQLRWDPKEPHNFVGGVAFGKWRRVTYVPLMVGDGPPPTSRPPPPTTGPPADVPTTPPSSPPGDVTPRPPTVTPRSDSPGDSGGVQVAAAFDWSDYGQDAFDRRHEPGRDYRPNDPTYPHPWGGGLGSPPVPVDPYEQGPGDYRPGVDPHPWGHGRDPETPLSEGRNGQPGYRPGEDPHPWGEGRDPSTPLGEGRNGQPGYRPGEGDDDGFDDGRDPATPLDEGRNGQPGYRPGESPHPWKDEFGNPGGFKKTIVQPYSPSMGVEQVINAPMLMGLGSVLSRAQNVTVGALDFRYATHPFDVAQTQLAHVPAVMRTESMGAELGVVAWNYTQRPETSRVSGGTSSGGTWHMPPELDIVDYRNGAPSSDIVASTSYRGATPGVYWSAGYPSASQGVLDEGFRWGFNPASSALEFARIASGSWVASLSLNATGAIVEGTGALTVPVGTTAEQPVAPTNGMIRYNSDTASFEVYSAGAWGALGGGGGVPQFDVIELDGGVVDADPALGGGAPVPAVDLIGYPYAASFLFGQDAGLVFTVPVPPNVDLTRQASVIITLDDGIPAQGTNLSTFSLQVDAEFVGVGGPAPIGVRVPLAVPGVPVIDIPNTTQIITPPTFALLGLGYYILSVRRFSATTPDSIAPMNVSCVQVAFPTL